MSDKLPTFDELNQLYLKYNPNPDTGLYDVKTFLDSVRRLMYKREIEGQIKMAKRIGDFDNTVEVFHITPNELDERGEPTFIRDYKYIDQVIAELEQQLKTLEATS